MVDRDMDHLRRRLLLADLRHHLVVHLSAVRHRLMLDYGASKALCGLRFLLVPLVRLGFYSFITHLA